ncbi:MAG: hypothetical protein ACE5G8_11955, partial [Anaerolineae bacterium]
MPKKSVDVLLLLVLVIARVQLDTLADNALPDRLADVRRLVEGWWPARSLTLLEHPQTDPVTMMLIVTAFGLVAVYALVDFWAASPRRPLNPAATYRLKLGLVYGIIALLVVGKTVLLMNLRHHSVPWSYSHDGGVIQTEVTVDYFLRGLNPYVEDYVNTPMAEWGIDRYRTALYHYPYLPWTFIVSTPFFLFFSRVWPGWFDERMVYLPLFVLTLALAQGLALKRRHKLAAVMLVGLNPVMALDVIFGLNDPFVLFWIVLAIYLALRGGNRNAALGSAALGLACAAKPTAWFVVPFWLLYCGRDFWGSRLIPPRRVWKLHLTALLHRTWPLPAAALLLLLPWFVWNPAAMFDDVWRWSAGQGETGYQIWGWGASNLVLALGLVADRFAYWPFILP